MEALEYPPEKKFHRFMALDEEDFNPNHVNITDEQYRKLCDR